LPRRFITMLYISIQWCITCASATD